MRRRDDTALDAARAEREKSEQRLEAVRKHVVRPLEAKGQRNQFAEQLRTLMEGGQR